ncbi:GTA-gp10 family protein [Polycladidibacter hongkongensis]|uniref:GTA-gp10 family protein n=1 Tax=Polycladidibacter hongkongensis TaxID=1647556 RepID=UPI00082D0FA0|nr:GTA-gp10 family protein [Pseudovibrio hongkongensis]
MNMRFPPQLRSLAPRANPHRGAISLTLPSGELCLQMTLAALAELEAELASGSTAALLRKVGEEGLNAKETQQVLVAALRGGGAVNPAASVEALRQCIGVQGLFSLALQVLLITFTPTQRSESLQSGEAAFRAPK